MAHFCAKSLEKLKNNQRKCEKEMICESSVFAARPNKIQIALKLFVFF
jgi:hypothetical protein